MLDGPFRGSEAVARGLLSRGRLFGPRYRRLFPDVHAPVGLAVDLTVLSRAAYLLVQHRGGILHGWSAAHLLGAACAPRGVPAEVLVDHDVRRRNGLRVTRGRAAPDQVVLAQGCRVTSPRRTAWDLARREPLIVAVTAVDALARVGGFSPAELLDHRLRHPGARGARRIDRVVAPADPGAESVMESRTRLMLVLGGLPRPVVQHRVRDASGQVVARVDLAYPAARLAIEYDGTEHFSPTRARRDRARDLLLADLGWYTMRLTHDDVWLAPPQTVERVRRLLAERLRPSSSTPGRFPSAGS